MGKELKVVLDRLELPLDPLSGAVKSEQANSMVKVAKHRQSHPVITQQLWSSITAIRGQRQIANMERITRHMSREHHVNQMDSEMQLQYCVKDGLLESYTMIRSKGSNAGLEQQGYKLPEIDEFEKPDSDWYCFNCHRPGEVLACHVCWRVFHPVCTSQNEDSSSQFVCAICKALKKKHSIKRKKLNTLLSYTIQRLREKSMVFNRIRGHERLNILIYRPMDLRMIERNCQQLYYKCPEEFHADARNILHNAAIQYGEYHDTVDLARLMVKDCIYDIEELKRCTNCYYLSNARPEGWFTQPCKPPHELVYARMRGFCFWPSKVIKKFEESMDVRFFGHPHERATIHNISIKPIDTDLATLGIKKSASFHKALEELYKYQALLAQPRSEYTPESTEDEGFPMGLNVDTVIIPSIKRKKKTKSSHHDEQQYKKKTIIQDSEVDESTFTSIDSKKQRPHKRSSTEENISDEKKRKKQRSSTQIDADIISDTDTENEDGIGNSIVSSSHVEPPVLTKIQSRTNEGDNDLVTSSSGQEHLDSHSHANQQVLPDSEAGVSIECQEVEPATNCTIIEFVEDNRSLHVSEPAEKIPSQRKGPPSPSLTSDPKTLSSCNCEEKFVKQLEEIKSQLLDTCEKDKQQALSKQAAALKKEFRSDIAKAVNQAVENKDKEIAQALQQKEKELEVQLNKKMKEKIFQTKKKQWCFNCEQEAIYHCCWNTAYCSVPCQQEHWHKEHKRVCRRKR